MFERSRKIPAATRIGVQPSQVGTWQSPTAEVATVSQRMGFDATSPAVFYRNPGWTRNFVSETTTNVSIEEDVR